MKNNFFRIAGITFMLSLSLFVLTCCSFGSQKEQNSKITLNFFNQKPEISTQYQKLARLYHAKHPNVNIQITTSGQGGGAAALQAKFASGEAPDIIMLGGLPEIDRYKEHLINLKNLQASKNIIPALVSGGLSNNRMVGIPVDLEAYGWSYNKAVFAKAGIDVSKITNYSEFLKAVQKLNAEKKQLGLEAVFGFNGGDTNSIASVSAQFTSLPYNNNLVKAFKSTTFSWKYEKQMKQYYDLIKKYNVQPILSVKYDPSVQDLFFNGKVAMIPQGNWIIPTLDGLEKGYVQKNLGMLPFFVKNSGSARILTGSSWYLGITNDHPHREKAAKDFINWMYTSKQAQNVIINEMRFVPATKNFDVSRLPDDLSKEIYRIGTSKKAQAPIHKQYPNGFTNQALGPYMQRYFVNRISWSNLKKEVSAKYRQLREIQSGE
ncbi:ABC transporter substrate-binding protein [Liquorilactobacillus satsumensis]|uniref:ABC transporter substrate-binding protein n=1 Tax=Liquorilactobacillus satsumensis TaxID=259059 RepID=UPI001E30EE24|nr:ABC transporter substrate-binding protein [Liquorilactobacillus satsumensis]MCC7667128.1 sugar ABC transporter substrate-binding protein [Liquorilactobacillus satsumensis]MCP9312453.1 carbohydrate ABC transporter substrate-binding protein [Liquorilactobacillus satsumensis]MCP9357721.1 carbohydrate ABC transporter substrate-binding protein [Liquorilactobacillus satsumensis]MCP9359742.1 carbohydrate ABC transporter substrate-binding protein [Liquorilactobacillus satsumensis]MCP9371513.1 carbo